MAEELASVGYESEEKRHPWRKAAFVLFTLVVGLAAATQTLAHKFESHEALGPHFRHVYFPGMFIAWHREWGDTHPVEFRIAISYGMAATAFMLLVFVIVSRIVSQSSRPFSHQHASFDAGRLRRENPRP